MWRVNLEIQNKLTFIRLRNYRYFNSAIGRNTNMTTTIKHKLTDSVEKEVKKSRKITDFFGKIKPTPKTKQDELQPLSTFKTEFKARLTDEQKMLLELEITTMEDSWFEALAEEFTKPYFIELKKFLQQQYDKKVTIFPPQQDIYSWSRLTPFHDVKVLVLGQDPYHNFNQAHGLAFSVKSPTPPPPSLKNIYKCLKIDYKDFVIPKTGDLTKWAQQGVLLLNACLTVKAHEANSHSKKGWESFTEAIIKKVYEQSAQKQQKLVFLLWGSPAQKRITNLKIKENNNLLILTSVHPSPLSARRGFFECQHFKKCNEWLVSNDLKPIDWNL